MKSEKLPGGLILNSQFSILNWIRTVIVIVNVIVKTIMHYALLIMNSIVVIVKTIMHYALLIMN